MVKAKGLGLFVNYNSCSTIELKVPSVRMQTNKQKETVRDHYLSINKNWWYVNPQAM